MTLLTAWLIPAVAAVLVVGPAGPYRSIPEALAVARPGDTIEVHGGTYPGGFVVDRPVALVGVGGPVIDGQGRGTVVTVTAPGAAVRGFTIRSSGTDLNAADAGIEVRAAGVTVEANQLDDVLYGISLDDAARSVVRGNRVRGKPLPPAQRGDGIRLWYSSDVVVEANDVEGARDCVIWYSAGVRLLDNRVAGGRYGLHFMYDDGAEIAGNVLRDNSVGAYLMYSRDVVLRGNLLASNRGPSGFGVGLKDVDDLYAEANWLVDNRVGLWIDNSPRSLDAESRFQRNVIAYNDIGIALQPAVERNTFAQNTFRENFQQVSVQGGGTPRGNHWSAAGRGNYWSDYQGFDADGDGVGDVPYRAETLLDQFLDRRAELRFFQFGLAAGAVEFAARAFPALRPAPKLIDERPLQVPPSAPPLPGEPPGQTGPAEYPWGAGLALGLVALMLGMLALGRGQRLPPASRRSNHQPAPVPGLGASLRVAGLTRRFGRLVAVDGVTFEVTPGEVVALWGPNGAGKTTILRCLLGLLPCSGEIVVAGVDARREGRRARRRLGYVPQEVALHDDLTVSGTAAFYAALKGADLADARAQLVALGLAGHAPRAVRGLSGGLRQRLAVALALLGDPAVLLLDEPTSNLDAAGREQVLAWIEQLKGRGLAVLFASHRLEEIEAVADRVLVLEAGRLVLACEPRELARRLGLGLQVRLVVPQERREAAVAALRAGGLSPSTGGRSIAVRVPPTEKALPIRLLERSGIAVTDFTLEEAADRTGEVA